MKPEAIRDHFCRDWTAFFTGLVGLPSGHSGSVKIRSPLRDDDETPSFDITLTGEHAGRWCDFGTGENGDAIDLFMRLRGITNFT